MEECQNASYLKLALVHHHFPEVNKSVHCFGCIWKIHWPVCPILCKIFKSLYVLYICPLNQHLVLIISAIYIKSTGIFSLACNSWTSVA